MPTSRCIEPSNRARAAIACTRPQSVMRPTSTLVCVPTCAARPDATSFASTTSRSSLILEVTESVLVAEPAAEAMLRQLKGTGVRLAIDDFGTGYSSLSYLRRFPIDIMKIDMEFTNEIETPEGEALFGGIVQLGRSLGLTIVAEGIERSAQRDLVTRSTCDH